MNMLEPNGKKYKSDQRNKAIKKNSSQKLWTENTITEWKTQWMGSIAKRENRLEKEKKRSSESCGKISKYLCHQSPRRGKRGQKVLEKYLKK